MITTVPTTKPTPHRTSSSDSDRLVAGLEAIIDATAGILAAQSLADTLQAMADALASIVPYTSLAVYEVDWSQRVCVPLLATGSYVEETMASRAAIDSSITGLAVLSGRLVYHGPGDPVHHSHVMPGTPSTDVESILVAPLLVGDQVRGTLNVWREADDPAERENVMVTPAEMLLLERFASLAALAYANSSQRDQLRDEALTDKLTGLRNRRHCDDLLAATLKESRRRQEPTSIVCFDIDAFKSINDTYGHAAGDAALRHFGEVLSAAVRAGDTACRTGGEEFVVVLPRTGAEEAETIAARVVEIVREAELGPERDLTVSAGVATTTDVVQDPDRLMQHADEALLAAKRSGRDRVVVAG